jgi:signal recognition particle receptor subunit beta
MPLVNYATHEITCKIVFYGPGRSGKTTNLQYIHGSLPQERKGEMVSLATETDRTLFFDFLPLDLGDISGFRTRLQLYTVPGQVYYNATRKLVLRGADGVVFVADSVPGRMDANIESLRNLQENLLEHGFDIREIPTVLQYNKRDVTGATPVPEMQEMLNFRDAPSHQSIATRGEGVFPTLRTISELVLRSVSERFGASAGSGGDAK